MYKLANSVVSSFDGMWQSYVKGVDEGTLSEEEKMKQRQNQLWELAQAEGDDLWLKWINDHVWTYIGLSAPLLGAMNPVRAVLSGEDMGMPMSEKSARDMEICELFKSGDNVYQKKINFVHLPHKMSNSRLCL